MIGDRVEIDMEMAVKAGINGLLVLTGVTKKPPHNTNGFKVSESIARAFEKKIFELCKK